MAKKNENIRGKTKPSATVELHFTKAVKLWQELYLKKQPFYPIFKKSYGESKSFCG
jgi:hypothetical protein